MKPYTDSDRWRAEIKQHREAIRCLRLLKSNEPNALQRLKLTFAIGDRRQMIRDLKRAIANAKQLA